MLIAKNLSVSLGTQPLLHDISLALTPGSTQVLMGPNGSGKSSLALSLMGHPQYQVTAGAVELSGEDLLVLPTEKRARAGLFLATQYSYEIPGVKIGTFLKEAYRALTGLEIDHAALTQKFKDLLELVGLHQSFAQRTLNEGFSGGERKRFEVLQLLLFRPQVAILDEIDSGLDIDGLAVIAHALKVAQQENPRLALFIITHYARLCNFVTPDAVHILKGGRLIQSGDQNLAGRIEKQGYDGLLL